MHDEIFLHTKHVFINTHAYKSLMYVKDMSFKCALNWNQKVLTPVVSSYLTQLYKPIFLTYALCLLTLLADTDTDAETKRFGTRYDCWRHRTTYNYSLAIITYSFAIINDYAFYQQINRFKI